MDSRIEKEVDANFDYFQGIVGSIIDKHAGQYALIRAQKIVTYASSAGDAATEGYKRYPDEMFSVQLVTQEPLDLGFYSHAASTRQGS